MPHNILTVKNASLRLAPTRTGTPVFTEFGDALSLAQANISSEDFEWKPISGNMQGQTGALQWEVQLDLGQDTKTGGLMQYLIANHGAAGKCEFFPKGGTTTPKFVGDVVLKAPSALGGGVGIATASVTLRVDGQPVITWEP